ncbi:deoxyribonuclease-2-alpha-like [Cololabis saira]|uniref:deoxyribonuclease-2-alpha-like n=1 Tax=Cololabis saira TaxID=129043 RepID=UPI002AD2C4E5|nr:deoxyribonuclease-2-alpha-like [Cololabis saira]
MEMPSYTSLMRFFSSVGILLQGCHSDVTCKNDTGHDVDWYILYKQPNLNGFGSSYLYMDDTSDGWIKSGEDIDSRSGSLGRTLKPLLDFYDKKTEGFGYMLYNDQPPPPYVAASSFGHSKGIVILDRQTGVWLSHSTPKFPTYRRRDFWPKSGNMNAQTFICVTFPYDQFREIGLQLKYIHAYSYDSDVPTTFHEELRCVAQRSCYPKSEPWTRLTVLTSVSRRSFRSYAKYSRFRDDLYSGFIVQSMPQNLFVKSWGKLRKPLASNCSSSIPHHVYNVTFVQWPGRTAFSNTVDHSKWCVTADGSWTCIADMNREESQMSRGGGAICTDNPGVGRAFRALISDYVPCKSLHRDARDREL